jgi:hypothetical protein
LFEQPLQIALSHFRSKPFEHVLYATAFTHELT